MKISEQETTRILTDNEDAIRAIARKLYLSGGTEEDLVQEGRIGFAEGLESYDESRGGLDSDAFKAFALMCAKRQMLDAIRKAGRKKNEPLSNAVPLDGSLSKTDQLISGPEQQFLDKEEHSEKLQKIALTKTEKQIVEMLVLGQNLQEIAQSLGKSKKAIDDSLYRIRKKLKGEE